MEAPLAESAPVAVAPAHPPAREVEPSLPVSTPGVRSLEIVGLLTLCVLADLCLWGHLAGAGSAVLLVAAPVILTLAAATRRLTPRLWVIAGILLLLAGRLAWQATPLGIALGGAGLVAFAVALRLKRSYLPELGLSALSSLVASFGSLARMVIGTVSLARPGRLLVERRWIALLAPVVVVGLFGVLFTAANPVVEEWTAAVWASLIGGDHTVTYVRIAFWAASALAAALLLAPSLREPTWIGRLGPGHALEATGAIPSATSLATARNVLVGVNAMFLVYNTLDAAYLWAGQLPPRIGYTEYAHRGALWLTASLAVSTVVLGVLFRGAMSVAAEARRTRILAYVWAGQNLVLAAGVIRRISLYVDHSGLTRQLMLGIFGSLLVCAGLALIVVKLARHRTGLWLLRRQLDALAVAVVLFAVLPTEALCAWYNVGRVADREYRPLLHLFRQPLTAESVPAVASMLDNEDPVIRRGAAGILRRQGWRLAAEQRRAEGWAGWQGSRSTALDAIAAARPQIDAALSGTTAEESEWALERLALRCRSSVAKPIRCEPLPTAARPARTPIEPVELRPMRADGEGARAKPRRT